MIITFKKAAIGIIGIFSIAIQGCGTLTTDIEPTTTQQSPANSTQKGQFKPETLYALLVAEFAMHRQQHGAALIQYKREARRTADIGIIIRATRLSEYVQDYPSALDMGKLWLKQTPNNIEANAIVAGAYSELNQPSNALNHAETILSLLKPSDKQSHEKAAIVEAIASYSRKATPAEREILIQRYRQLSQQYPAYSAPLVGLSRLYQQQNTSKEATIAIKQALRRTPDYLPAIIQETRLLQWQNNLPLAIKKLRTQIEKNPQNQRLRLIYARLLVKTDLPAAYTQFTLLTESAPERLNLVFSRAIIALELKKVSLATQLLEQLLQANYKPNTIHYYLGNIAEQEQHTEKAITHYASVTGGSDFRAAQSQAAQLIATDRGLTAAQAHFNRLRQRLPNQQEQLYSAEADVLIYLNATPQALNVLSKGIKHFPDSTALWYERASLYEQADQLVLMEKDLRHILTLQPENASALNALGYYLTTRTSRHQEALTLIEKALNIRPDDSAILDSMGWTLFNLGDYPQAIHYLRQAFKDFPDPEIAAHLGEALWVTGQKEEAKTIWSNNLKANPNAPHIIETLQRLDVKL